jgi:hypothetical protein
MQVDGPLSYILVVDALDECDDENNIRTIVQLLAETRLLKGVRLRVFLTSRPEVPIRHGFGQIPHAEHWDFVLHKISPSTVDHDIFIFLEYSFQLIARERQLSADWPGADTIAQLVRSASGLFIWAATAYRFIKEGIVTDRLDAVLNDSIFTDNLSTDGSSAEDSDLDASPILPPKSQLNSIYLVVLKSPIRKYKKQERKKWYRLIRATLGAIVLLFSPLSTSSLARLLDVSTEHVHQTLYQLHSILDIPQDLDQPLRLHHPSFRDFLLDKEQCGDANFWVDEKQAHQTLADNCIKLMSTCLRQNICSVDTPGTFVAEVKRTRVQQCLPPELQYACLHWIHHIQKSGAQPSDNGQLYHFLQAHLLHWLEALGWIGKVADGVHAIASLETFISVSTAP